MRWIFLSPHFDDVSLSCGGLVWELVQRGNQVSIWTICAGEIPEGRLSPFAETLHARWQIGQNAPAQRKIEDLRSCQRLGASQFCFSIPDCIYRRDLVSQNFMYASEAALNGDLHIGDMQVSKALQLEINAHLDTEDILVCPLGLGNHVDHQLSRVAAEGLNHPLVYYSDFPYVLKLSDQLHHLETQGWVNGRFNISNAGLAAWTDSVAAHASQISTFWSSQEEMRRAIETYMEQQGGCRLWKKPGQGEDFFSTLAVD
jgi:LmbE family N-acetylglucosaminyl deacetylase